MKPGVVFDSLEGMTVDEQLDTAIRLGVSAVEVNTCGWSRVSHFDLEDMRGRKEPFLQAFSYRRLEVIGLNADRNGIAYLG